MKNALKVSTFVVVLKKLGVAAKAVGTALKAIASPAVLLVAALSFLGAVLASLLSRLKPVQDSFKAIGGAIRSALDFARIFSVEFSRGILKGINKVIDAIPGLRTALDKVGGFFSSWYKGVKDGLDALREDFKSVTDFLGFTGKAEVQVEAGSNLGPQLTPEEIAAQEERVAAKRKEITERIEDLQIASIKNTTQRAIAEIEKRYEREISLAKEAGEDIAVLRRAKEQELANLRRSLVETYYRRLQSLDNQIARERAQGINDEFKRRQREAEISRDIALRAENITVQEREKINALYADRIKNIEADRIRSIADFDKEIQDSIFREQSEGVASRLQQELDSIKRKYDAERSEAKRLGADLAAIDNLRRAREERAFREAANRRREEQERLQQERLDANTDIQRQIDRLDIDLGGGTEFEKALQRLELERDEALIDSSADAEIILDRFERQARLLRQQEEARKLDSQQGRAFGAFDAIQIAALGSVGAPGKTKEQELLERQVFEAERQTRIQEEIRDGQGAR